MSFTFDSDIPYSPRQRPEPLRIRKPSGNSESTSGESRTRSNSAGEQSPRTIFPPRESSLPRRDSGESTAARYQEIRPRRPTIIGATESAHPSYRAHRSTSSPPGSPTTEMSTPQSAYSSQHHNSDESSGIMGDFIPFEASEMTPIQSSSWRRARSPSETVSPPRGQAKLLNPYEFDPDSPYQPSDQSKFPASSRDQIYAPAQRFRPTHMKNSHSVGNGLGFNSSRKPDSTTAYTGNGPRKVLHRSESSPNISQSPFGIQTTRSNGNGQISSYPDRSESPFGGFESFENASGPSPRSPPRLHHQGSFPVQSAHRPRSPTKILEDVLERDEFNISTPASYWSPRASAPAQFRSPAVQAEEFSPQVRSAGFRSRSPMKKMFGEHGWLGHSPPGPSDTPQKRSRSPMKKMFGEHGWLGSSPNDNSSPKKSTSGRGGTMGGHKKTTIMGKLKHKIEEFAEKADINGSRSGRPDYERAPKLSMLAISLAAPQQARIYMEAELMLVHTANCYLMTQFKQGRTSVDTIKKTVDMWKSKGRPVVIEFMYDQATQRELVAANQHNFRFHGDRAGDHIRINSMLYSWKNVASLMAVRTFCAADTVILKLLFDIEQILELLGAGEPMMVRLQQIRAAAGEMMRVARAKEHIKPGRESQRGRESNSSKEFSDSIARSDEDPYGDLEMAPGLYDG